MEKRWILENTPQESFSRLREELKLTPLLCSILAQRGLSDYGDARKYFNPDLGDLHNPFLMKDMEKAVTRILKAISNREKILVFGDYDVDGTTSVACMYCFLCSLTDPSLVDFYVPHRYLEGYGISAKGIRHAAENGFTLVIALDCGIKSPTLIREALEKGVEFIVCDHHIPGAELPPAVAILDPKQSDCPYPYKELCGCGVGFKLICALAERSGLPASATLQYLDLVATAIAADIVPMTGENRILTWHGLKKVNEDPCTGIGALIELSGAKKPLDIGNLVFLIAPRVNAAGRMDDARKAIQLFIETDPAKAKELANALQDDNTERRETDNSITEEALEIIRAEVGYGLRRSTVVYQPHWHKGVIGIVASRLMEHHYRPTIVLTRSGELISGSARSIPGFNIHDGLDACSDLLIGFGGHYFAAGMTMDPEKLDAFSERFDEVVRRSVPEECFTQQLRINAVISFGEITPSLFRTLSRMEPFGPDSPAPVFMAEAVEDDGRSRIVKDKHIRFSVKQNGVHFTGIGFNLAGKFHLMENGNRFDVAFTIDENEWNGNKSLQLKVIDLRPSAVN